MRRDLCLGWKAFALLAKHCGGPTQGIERYAVIVTRMLTEGPITRKESIGASIQFT
jgi:hypothetical protein